MKLLVHTTEELTALQLQLFNPDKIVPETRTPKKTLLNLSLPGSTSRVRVLSGEDHFSINVDTREGNDFMFSPRNIGLDHDHLAEVIGLVTSNKPSNLILRDSGSREGLMAQLGTSLTELGYHQVSDVEWTNRDEINIVATYGFNSRGENVDKYTIGGTNFEVNEPYQYGRRQTIRIKAEPEAKVSPLNFKPEQSTRIALDLFEKINRGQVNLGSIIWDEQEGTFVPGLTLFQKYLTHPNPSLEGFLLFLLEQKADDGKRHEKPTVIFNPNAHAIQEQLQPKTEVKTQRKRKPQIKDTLQVETPVSEEAVTINELMKSVFGIEPNENKDIGEIEILLFNLLSNLRRTTKNPEEAAHLIDEVKNSSSIKQGVTLAEEISSKLVSWDQDLPPQIVQGILNVFMATIARSDLLFRGKTGEEFALKNMFLENITAIVSSLSNPDTFNKAEFTFVVEHVLPQVCELLAELRARSYQTVELSHTRYQRFSFSDRKLEAHNVSLGRVEVSLLVSEDTADSNSQDIQIIMASYENYKGKNRSQKLATILADSGIKEVFVIVPDGIQNKIARAQVIAYMLSTSEEFIAHGINVVPVVNVDGRIYRVSTHEFADKIDDYLTNRDTQFDEEDIATIQQAGFDSKFALNAYFDVTDALKRASEGSKHKIKPKILKSFLNELRSGKGIVELAANQRYSSLKVILAEGEDLKVLEP